MAEHSVPISSFIADQPSHSQNELKTVKEKIDRLSTKRFNKDDPVEMERARIEYFRRQAKLMRAIAKGRRSLIKKYRQESQTLRNIALGIAQKDPSDCEPSVSFCVLLLFIGTLCVFLGTGMLRFSTTEDEKDMVVSGNTNGSSSDVHIAELKALELEGERDDLMNNEIVGTRKQQMKNLTSDEGEMKKKKKMGEMERERSNSPQSLGRRRKLLQRQRSRPMALHLMPESHKLRKVLGDTQIL